MLQAGIEVLRRDGVKLGAATFSYADAFELLQDEHGIKVTRGSVHERIWSTQEAWQLDVLTESIRHNEQHRQAAVDAAIAQRILELPVETPAQRKTVLAESARVAGLEYLNAVTSNPSFRMFPVVVAAWKASASTMPEFDKLGALLTTVQSDALHVLADGTRSVLTDLHWDQPKRGLTLDAALRTYAVSATTLAYSHTFRLVHDPAAIERVQARCPDGEYRQWNHFGLALWLIIQGLFEPRSLADDSAEAPQ